jgi:hypothetical protein
VLKNLALVLLLRHLGEDRTLRHGGKNHNGFLLALT